jgi:beta-glucosidase
MASISFPKNFLWGTASASYQIEGAPSADGKGESIWDRFSHTPGKIKHGDTGDVACDFYHRYRDDIAMMADLGLNAARISLAWPRIVPNGKGEANHKGIDFYNRVIDELLKHNIQPFVTLYHWDLPQMLEDGGGWTNRDAASYFGDYAAVCAKAFGDRVKHWMAFNEPWIFTVLGYMFGIHAPGLRDRKLALRAGHVVNLAQGLGVRAIRANTKPDMVGTAFSMQPIFPKTDSPEDREAAERYHRFNNVWFLETAMEGRYPKIFLEGTEEEWLDVRPGDMEIVKAPLDFIGINLYTRMTIAHDPHDKMMGTRPAYHGEENELTDFGWEVYPPALSEMILRIAHDYPKMPIYVTENGASYGEKPDADGQVRDQRRIRFLRGYIAEMGRAIEKGADVRGYFLWTFTDNFEWAEGFQQRFGIVYCDFETQQRIIKESGRWYSELARTNVLDFDPRV